MSSLPLIKQPQPKISSRIIAFDILRGAMIAYVIFLHALIQRVFSSDGDQFAIVVDQIPLWSIILLSPLILLSLWGTVFTFISGASTAFSLAKKHKEKPNQFGSVIKKKIFHGIAFYLVFMLEKLFFTVRMIGHPVTTYSMLTGTLEQRKFQWPTLLHLTSSSTLESLAITSILLSLILYIFWKKNISKKKSVVYLLIFAGMNLVITYILRIALPPPEILRPALVNQGQFFLYSLYLRLIADRFAHFPVFAFGLIGAAIGIIITLPNAKKNISRISIGLALPLLGIFSISLIRGFDIIESFDAEMVPFPLQCFNIALQVFLLMILLSIFDFRSKPLGERIQKRIGIIQKYSALSMTIYILEPFFSQIWYLVFENIYRGPFFTDLAKILVYLEVCVIFWAILVKFWAKHNYKYSFEWIMQKIAVKFEIFYDNYIRFSKPNPIYLLVESSSIQVNRS